MFRSLSLALVAGGVVVLEVSMDNWIRLIFELILGVLAVVLASVKPRSPS